MRAKFVKEGLEIPYHLQSLKNFKDTKKKSTSKNIKKLMRKYMFNKLNSKSLFDKEGY
jgi:hypothetical protein